MSRPGEGARAVAREAADRAATALERPRADRRPAAGAAVHAALRAAASCRLAISLLDAARTSRSPPPERAGSPSSFDPSGKTARAGGADGAALRAGLRRRRASADPPVEVEIAGCISSPGRRSADGLAVGDWRGEATVGPERLRFSVPATPSATDHAQRARVAIAGRLRRGGRTVTFELLFLVLPDRPGSFALDQQVRTMVPESNTLVSPEILARAPAGETRSVRRCFDPPAGLAFRQGRAGAWSIVERLGWLEDIGDPTLNGGSVEFASTRAPGQVCLVVTAKPVTAGGAYGHDRPLRGDAGARPAEERVVKSGVRALDWREAVRVPIEPGVVEWSSTSACSTRSTASSTAASVRAAFPARRG